MNMCEYCDKSFKEYRELIFHAAYTHNLIAQVADFSSCKDSGREGGIMAANMVVVEGEGPEGGGMASGATERRVGVRGGNGASSGIDTTEPTGEPFRDWEPSGGWEDQKNQYVTYKLKK